MPLNDYAFSMQMRDTIAKMVREEIDRQRPRYRYGTVTGIDRVSRKVDVQLNGETASVRVNMGAVQPAANGQIVRVEGIGTDKFVTEIIGGQWTSDDFTNLTTKIGTVEPYHSSGPVSVTWEGDVAASGPYSLIARGYRPRGGDAVAMISTSDGIMLIPAYENAEVLDWQPPPQWYHVSETVGLQNGWVDFQSMYAYAAAGLGQQFYTDYMFGQDPYAWYTEHNRPAFTKTASGIVKLRGLLKSGTTTQGTVLFNLPPGYRPAKVAMFAARHNTGTGRIDVRTNGDVVYFVGDAGWTSLANVTFPAADVAPNEAWTHVPTYANSYRDYNPNVSSSTDFAQGSYWIDRNDWIHYRGLVNKNATYVHNQAMFTMPTGNLGSTRLTNVMSASGNGPGNVSFVGSGGREVRSKNPSMANYQSLDGICYPRATSYSDDEWKIPQSLAGTWTAWDPTDVTDGYAHPQVVKTRDGLCAMRGTVKMATNQTAASAVIWTVPAGYRPKAIYLFATVANDLGVRTDVRPNGDVVEWGTISANLYWAFDYMTWIAEW
jgi:hypothetical protein